MANTFQNISHVTKEALMILHSNLSTVRNCDTSWSKDFAKKGAKIGDTTNIRKRQRFTSTSDTIALTPEDIADQTVALTINKRETIGMEFTLQELTLDADDFRSRYLEPAMAQLAAKVEEYVNGEVVTNSYAMVGTAGTTPANMDVVIDAGVKLTTYLAPRGMKQRYLCIDPLGGGGIVKGDKSLFNAQSSLSEQYKTGLIGSFGGFDIAESQIIPTLTNGTGTVSAAVVNGGTQTGNSLIIDNVGNALTYTKGQVFTVAGVYQVNYETRIALPQLQQFVVTADVTADGSGNATLAIEPALTTSGQYQTVDASPADNAVLTFVGAASTSYTNNIAFHKNAIAFASIAEELPSGSVEFAESATYDGITLTIIRQYDVTTHKMTTRADIIFGATVVQPEHVVRVIGA